MEFRRARIDDFEKIAELYKYVIDNTEHFSTMVRWVYGLHPCDETVKAYIEEGSMYILLDGDTYVAVMAAPLYQTEDYDPIPWDESISKDEIITVHILAVSPDYQKQGIAKYMLTKSIELAKENNKKAVRLDTFVCNTRAQHMYESFGFTKRGTQNAYTRNAGNIDFIYYEYKL